MLIFVGMLIVLINICVDTVNGLAVVSNRYTTRGGFI